MRFLITLFLGAFAASSALAAPTLIIDSITGNNVDVVVDDNGAGDVDPAVNDIAWISAVVDGWDVDTTTITANQSGTAPDATLFSGALRNNNTTTQTLMIAAVQDFGSNPFTSTLPLSFLANASEVSGGATISFYAQVNQDPAAPAVKPVAGTTADYSVTPVLTPDLIFGSASTVLASTGLGAGINASTIFAPTSPYATALIAVITAPAGASVKFDFSVNPVPEPGFYGLLALALSGLFFVRFRRRSAIGELNS